MQALASPEDTIASPRWGGGGPFRSGGSRPRTRRPPPTPSGHGHGCGWPLVDRVAGWVGGGIATVFFASLERCSCVNVRTQDDLADDEQRDSEAPLMSFDDGNSGGEPAATANAEAGRRRGAAGRRGDKGRRAGGAMGCHYGDF